MFKKMPSSGLATPLMTDHQVILQKSKCVSPIEVISTTYNVVGTYCFHGQSTNVNSDKYQSISKDMAIFTYGLSQT